MLQLPRTVCCEEMKRVLTHNCDKHADPFDCPDFLIQYIPKFDEYGIVIHDGGTAIHGIAYCPWCGAKLPDSKRDRWFAELAAKGYDDPAEQAIPAEYRTDAWYRAESS